MPMEGHGSTCPRCNAAYTSPPIKHERPAEIQKLPTDPVDRAWALRDFSKLTPEQIAMAASRIQLSTTASIPGKQLSRSLGIVTGIYSFAFGAVFEAVAGLARNLAVSGSSAQTEQHMNNGIAFATQTMQGRALALGADAIVGIKYEFEEFSGANNLGVIAVIATGTATLYET
jgi:uncharacterized protein YbjQ (UPF0145 family)